MTDFGEVHSQNQRYYDSEARVYDDNRYASRPGRRVDAFHRRMLDQLLVPDLSAKSVVLEFGCGTGRLLEHLSSKDVCLFGIDTSQGMLSIARDRLKARPVQLVKSTGGPLPFDDRKFDAVYSILVMNLIPDYESVFNEISRVTKPSGVFVFNVPNLMSFYFAGGAYVNMRGKTVTRNESGHRYSHWFSPKEWRLALLRAGFEVEQVLGQPPHVRWVDNAKALNAAGLGLLLSKSIYIKARRSSPG